ncbi:hypothetical protein F2Q68_00008253 [Brassica cretica]|uniref:S-protein homolog n=1 Tax=Brassica cretica TaxID=69181 RepID=A0A8S9KTI8_BRACR|nr:hypothetical protein F2Q68_00008253 [Brassica cretica]
MKIPATVTATVDYREGVVSQSPISCAMKWACVIKRESGGIRGRLIDLRFNVEISNGLEGNKILQVTCSEKGVSTGVQFLDFNSSFLVKFRIYPKTLIWCNLWKSFVQGPNCVHHVKFNAFVGNEKFIHDVCGSRKPDVCFWQAREDGVYVRNNLTGAFKFMYKWDIN